MSFWQDLRTAARPLRRSPVFTIAAVVSLALGIGANTAIFTLLDQVLLRQLPVPHPEQLVLLDWNGPRFGVSMGRHAFSYPAYTDIRDGNQAFSGVLGRYLLDLSVSYRGRTTRLPGELVSGNYFEVLGVRPALGRTFTPADDRVPGGHPLAVLSYSYWASRLNADREIVGKTITVDGLVIEVIGVSEKGFDGVQLGTSPAMRLPLAMKAQLTQGWFAENINLTNRLALWVNVFARLRPGVTREQAAIATAPLFASILQREVGEIGNVGSEGRQAFLRSTLDLLPGSQGRTGFRENYDLPLRVMMAIVGLVLLIACANVANLLLERAASRRREFGVRLALGASPARIVRQSLAESLLLAVLGGAGGLLVSMWTAQALIGFVPTGEVPLGLRTTPDLRIFAFTLSVSLAAGLLFGVAPALASRRIDLIASLKQDSRGASGRTGWLRHSLVIGQVALSVVLLIGAGHFLRTLVNLRTVDIGMRTNDVLTFSVNPSLNGYGKEKSRQFYRDLLDSLRATPGVASAAGSAIRVLDDDWWRNSITVEGGLHSPDRPSANLNLVSAGYFTTMGMPLLAGRDFTAADASSSQKVAIVNETFVRTHLGTDNPIGRRLGIGGDPNTKTDVEIVGVMRDAKYINVRDTNNPQVFFDNDQNEDIQQINVYVKTSVDPRVLVEPVRSAVRELDADVPLFDMRTMQAQAEVTLTRERMVATLASAFGLLATVLSAVGVYGLMAFTVTRRTREIGVRVALGASRATVLWLVMRQVLLLIGAGTAVAVPAALALIRLVQSQLYGVQPGDRTSTIAAALLLGAIAALAGYLPARRAASIDPLLALRVD